MFEENYSDKIKTLVWAHVNGFADVRAGWDRERKRELSLGKLLQLLT